MSESVSDKDLQDAVMGMFEAGINRAIDFDAALQLAKIPYEDPAALGAFLIMASTIGLRHTGRPLTPETFGKLAAWVYGSIQNSGVVQTASAIRRGERPMPEGA